MDTIQARLDGLEERDFQFNVSGIFVECSLP